MVPTRVLVTASLKIFINNQPYALGTGWNHSISYGTHSVRGLDSPLPFELADGPITITLNIRAIRLRLDGGLEGFGIVAPPDHNTLAKYITICVIDRHTDKVIFQSDKARVVGQSWQADQKGFYQGQFSVECIGSASDLIG